MKFLLKLTYLTARAKSFWQNFWTCDAYLRNSQLVSSPSSERNTVCLSPPSPSRGKNRSELQGRHYHRWLDWGYGYDPKMLTLICVMEIARVSRTEESTTDAFQSESHADFFFLHGEDYSLRIRPRRSNSESTLICWGSKATETHRLSQEAKETNPARGVCLHHDNAFAHTVHSVQIFLKKIMTVLRVTSHPTPWRGWLWAVYQS